VIEGRIVIIGLADLAIKIEPALVFTVDDLCGPAFIKIVVFHHEFDTVFEIIDQEDVVRVGMIAENVLAAASQDDHVAFFCDLRDDDDEVVQVKPFVQISAFIPENAIHQALGNHAGDDPGKFAAGFPFNRFDPVG